MGTDEETDIRNVLSMKRRAWGTFELAVEH